MGKIWSTWAFLLIASIFGLIQPDIVRAQVVKLDATEDSSVNEEAKDLNMNSQSVLLVGVDQQGSANNRAYSFVRFSPLNLPAGTEISKANLVMYLASSTGLSTANLMIYRVTSNWHENTLTWNNKPTFADGTPISVNNIIGTKKLDITYIVRNWKNNPSQNFGIQIAPTTVSQAHMRGFNNRSYRNLYIEVTYVNSADVTPPVISNVDVNPFKTTTEIQWTTNELLKEASVEYGPTTAYGKKTQALSLQTTNFKVNLISLKASTPYVYKIKSVDYAGNVKTKTGTFTTLGSTDGSAASSVQLTTDQKTLSDLITVSTATITNLKATEITYKSALITWDTNLATDSLVEYGKSQRTLDKQKSSTAFVTKHSVRIDGLATNTRYYYLVKSKATNVREVSFPPGDPQIFLTKQPTAAETAADIQAARDLGRQVGEDLNNLDFSFGLGSTNQSGTTQSTQSGSGTTTASSGTALKIYDPRVTDATTNSGIARWVTNITATTQVFYWRPGFYAKSIGNTAHTTNHVIALSNLEANTQYNYLLRSVTNWGETIVSPQASFTTRSVGSSATALTIEGLSISNITGTAASFSWTTNKPANELLVFTDMTTNHARFKEDNNYQSEHSQTLTDLTPETVYSIKLTVKTQAGEIRVTTGEFKTKSSSGLSDSSVGGTAPLDSEVQSGYEDLSPEEQLAIGADDFFDPDQIRETTGEELLVGDQKTATDDSKPVTDTNLASDSPVSVLGSIISRIPFLNNLLDTASAFPATTIGSKPDLIKIFLILLVIILILILIFRKRPVPPAPTPSTVPNPTPKTQTQPSKITLSKTTPTDKPKKEVS